MAANSRSTRRGLERPADQAVEPGAGGGVVEGGRRGGLDLDGHRDGVGHGVPPGPEPIRGGRAGARVAHDKGHYHAL